MLEKLLPPDMYKSLVKDFPVKDVSELRIRNGLPLKVNVCGRYLKVKSWDTGDSYITSSNDIDYIVGKATKHSVYASNDTITEGFIPFFEGIRIGVCGEGVLDNGKLVTVKNISYMTIRLAKEIKTCGDRLLYDFSKPTSFLILSPPGAGKTTLLREMLRRISVNGYNCLAIDERGEIAAQNAGENYFDLGENTDVMTAVPKTIAMEGIIRSMRPDMIFTDEIYGENEVKLIQETLRAGIKVGATVHTQSRFDLLKDEVFKKLLFSIPYVIELTDSPEIGTLCYEGFVNVNGIGW